jgi:hypothetical protein
MSLKELLSGYVNGNRYNKTLNLDSELLKQADIGDIFSIIVLDGLGKCDAKLYDEDKIGLYEKHSQVLFIDDNVSNIVEIAILLTWINKCSYRRIYHFSQSLLWNGRWVVPIENMSHYAIAAKEFDFYNLCKNYFNRYYINCTEQILKLIDYNIDCKSLTAVKNHLVARNVKSARNV